VVSLMTGLPGFDGDIPALFHPAILRWRDKRKAQAIIVISAGLCNPFQDLAPKWTGLNSSLNLWA
jgi:hypothetical protein